MLDEEWNVHICGRVKDVVKFRGFSISPAEIEEVETQLVPYNKKPIVLLFFRKNLSNSCFCF